jgi:hypothetical protein
MQLHDSQALEFAQIATLYYQNPLLLKEFLIRLWRAREVYLPGFLAPLINA